MENTGFETEKRVANLLGKKSYWERFWDEFVNTSNGGDN